MRCLRVRTLEAWTSGEIDVINWLPDETLRAACQMACYGFAALTAVVTYLFVPRW